MWERNFEKLTSFEKEEFRRLANYLLSHTYMVRYTYNAAQQMTLPNADYHTAARMFNILHDYFSFSGWRLDKNDDNGIISLVNNYDSNRLRIDRFTTLFLYTCRLIYEEGRESADGFRTVKTDTAVIVEKMRTLGLLEKERKGKTTQKERLEAQRALSHYNIIQKADSSAWSPLGNKIVILPSILSIIYNKGINDIKSEMEELADTDVDVAADTDAGANTDAGTVATVNEADA
jgi:hypothetical protein